MTEGKRLGITEEESRKGDHFVPIGQKYELKSYFLPIEIAALRSQ